MAGVVGVSDVGRGFVPSSCERRNGWGNAARQFWRAAFVVTLHRGGCRARVGGGRAGVYRMC